MTMCTAKSCGNCALMALTSILVLIVIVAAYMIGYNQGKLAVIGGEREGGGVADKGVAMLGSEKAPVTVVLWTEFQCPFSGRFATQTLPELKRAYIDTGKVKLIFKDYPLNFHPFAQQAAEGGKCVVEQGNDKFWRYHDLLFANQAQISLEKIKLWAAQAGADAAKFNECLDSGRMASVVAAEMADGQQKGIRGTPGFIVYGPGDTQGTLISGAQPFTAFQQAIDAKLTGQS